MPNKVNAAFVQVMNLLDKEMDLNLVIMDFHSAFNEVSDNMVLAKREVRK